MTVNFSYIHNKNNTLYSEIWNRLPEVAMQFPLAEASDVSEWMYIFQERDNENRLC